MANFKLKVVALVGRGNESQLYLACHHTYPKTYFFSLGLRFKVKLEDRGVVGRRVRRSLNLKRSLLPFKL
jgi:hypothetical protein